jgi:predicted nucleic acid-binding protein
MATLETKWLIDSSILVDVLRGNKSARAWLDSLPQDTYALSVITSAELLRVVAIAVNNARLSVNWNSTLRFGCLKKSLRLRSSFTNDTT